MKYIIHVNRQHIAMNAKDGGNRPVYTVKHVKETIYCRSFIAHGPIIGMADDNQLKCGARVWLETEGPIEFVDKMTFQEARPG